MSRLLQEIQNNICHLPANDIPLANKFIEKRDFESLYEIVCSDRIKHDAKKNSDGFFVTEEDQQISDSLCALEGNVLTYLRFIDPEYESVNDYDLSGDVIEEDFNW